MDALPTSRPSGRIFIARTAVKRRYVLYAVAVAGLGIAVLSDRLSPAQEEVVQPLARTTQQSPQAVPLAPASHESARAHADSPSDAVLALVARNAAGRDANADAQATAFSSHSWKPVASAVAASEPTAPLQPPFTYIGRQPIDGGWQVFIVEKDVVQAVKVSDLIDDQYKVLRISETEMKLEYLPLHTQFSMSLE